MALKSRMSARSPLHISLSSILFTLAVLCLNAEVASAIGISDNLPSFIDFSRIVQNGQKDIVRGVYVDDVLALPVAQQPSGNATYVSNNDSEVTQFGMAAQYGNIGLLAHNHKAGAAFSQLIPGQEVKLVYGDGHVETFLIKKVLKFQALQPTNPYSSFKNLVVDETLTAEQMFYRVYAGNHHLTFQTCIAADGESSWGRLFVIAVPKENA